MHGLDRCVYRLVVVQLYTCYTMNMYIHTKTVLWDYVELYASVIHHECTFGMCIPNNSHITLAVVHTPGYDRSYNFSDRAIHEGNTV